MIFQTLLDGLVALGEVVCAPGVERTEVLEAVFGADLAAFHAQSPNLAHRYRTL